MRILLVCLMLAGCNGNGILRGSGEIAPAPGGFVQYCAEHPERAECGGTK